MFPTYTMVRSGLSIPKSVSMCTPLESNLALLARHTDLCSSVLQCDAAKLEATAANCPSPQPSHVRRMQSLFGVLRRTYSEMLAQHPSLVFDLREFEQVHPRRPRAIDIVLSRCDEPLMPLLRILPAALQPSVRLRVRVVVFERCSIFPDRTLVPAFDVRDASPAVIRIAFRASPIVAFSSYISSVIEPSQMGWVSAGAALDKSSTGMTDFPIPSDLIPPTEPTALVLFLKTRALDALIPPPPTLGSRLLRDERTPLPVPRSTSKGPEQAQEELVARLREQWGAMERVETWSKGSGPEAVLGGQVKLLRLEPRQISPNSRLNAAAA